MFIAVAYIVARKSAFWPIMKTQAAISYAMAGWPKRRKYHQLYLQMTSARRGSINIEEM